MAQATGNNSICDSHAVTNPTAGQVIASITPSAQVISYWNLNLVTFQTGTSDSKFDNMQLQITGYASGTIVLGGLLSSTQFSPQTARVTVPVGGVIQVVAIANSAAACVYNASISATRLNSTGGLFF